jgi:hypothetical protein
MTAQNRNEPPPGAGVQLSSNRPGKWVWNISGNSAWGYANTEPLAIAAAWVAWDRIHGKPDQLPDATKMIGSDHSVAPNDMTSELAEALEELLEYTTCVLHGEGCFDTTELKPARAVLDKWRATRKDKP